MTNIITTLDPLRPIFKTPPPQPDILTTILAQQEQNTTPFMLATAVGPTYPLQTVTTQKSGHNSVNQGAVVPVPAPHYDLIDSTVSIRDNLTSPIYQGHIFGDKKFANPAYKYVIPIFLCFVCWPLSSLLGL